MAPDPFMATVTLRAWGTDDPRVLHDLRAENQPGRTFRYKTIRGRALSAGYPAPTVLDSNRAATVALERLEGAAFVWNGDRHRDWLFQPRHNQIGQHGEDAPPVEDYAAEDGPVSIFDE